MYSYSQSYHRFTSKNKTSVVFNYLLAIPQDMAEDERLPLIVFLHGAGERGTDPSIIKAQGLAKMLDAGLPARAIVLAPQITDSRYVWNNYVDELHELIEQIVDEHNIDRSRISLTGLSMGGYGTWEMGVRFGNYFSALAPICGGGMPWRAESLKNIPIRTFHGDADDVVPLSATVEMVDAINRRGGHAELTVLPGVGHHSWVFAYEETDLVEWLVAQTTNT